MAVSVNYNCGLTVDETFDLSIDDVTDPTARHDIGSVAGTRTATSDVKATKVASITGTLTAGAETLDLTALDKGNLPNETFTGLKVKNWKISCPSSNTAGVAFVVGAANPYDLFGSASDRITILPGQTQCGDCVDQLENVDATHKTLDLSSGDVDATYSIVLAAGGT